MRQVLYSPIILCIKFFYRIIVNVDISVTINFQQLEKSLFSNDSILLIDVRNRTEVLSEGRIYNSFNVPLNEILRGAFNLKKDILSKEGLSLSIAQSFPGSETKVHHT